MLSKEEVKHIADLARIKLGEPEIEKYQHQLSVILDYFKEIQKIKVDNVKPLASVSGLKNVLRPDVPRQESQEKKKALIEAASEKEKGLIKVKSVFER